MTAGLWSADESMLSAVQLTIRIKKHFGGVFRSNKCDAQISNSFSKSNHWPFREGSLSKPEETNTTGINSSNDDVLLPSLDCHERVDLPRRRRWRRRCQPEEALHKRARCFGWCGGWRWFGWSRVGVGRPLTRKGWWKLGKDVKQR